MYMNTIQLQQSYKKDRTQGKKYEEKLLETLNENNNKIKFKACRDPFHLFDFYYKSKTTNQSIRIELKSRNIKSTQFSTTIVGSNKVDKAYKYYQKNIDVYFMISFIDTGVIYLKYNPKLFKKFERKNIYRVDRGISKQHVMIPVKLMKELCEIKF